MFPFALRLRTLNATVLDNESAFRHETDGSVSPPDLHSLSQRLDPDQQGRDMVPTGEH
jgi:hypothetical protein